MKRLDFIKSLAILPFLSTGMTLKELSKISEGFKATATMPALFVGHGSPMNAIEDNEFSRTWQRLGKELPKPNAILCISAHWETIGTFVTAMEAPKTIHDFGGFPRELFAVQYPAKGSDTLVNDTKQAISKAVVELDHEWGLDHGAWSVIKHMYPEANVPVVQLSLDYRQGAAYHYELAKELATLRNKGVLIVGSGNMVHNLGIMDWRNANQGYDWAVTANEKFKSLISAKNHSSLINYSSISKEAQMSIPSPEHYLPLLYILALQNNKEEASFFNDKEVYGSISMTGVMIG